MFEPCHAPRVFAQEPGADFPAALARGLRARLAGQPPHAIARVEVFVNTARMRSALQAALTQTPGFLPRIRLITDLGAALPGTPAPGLRRLLDLAELVRALLRADPRLGGTQAAFGLAQSLLRAFDEMQSEGVDPAVLDRIDVSSHSQHWDRALQFLRLVRPFLTQAPDAQRRQRLAVTDLIDRWRSAPPAHPVIIAGSTGSRGTTALLMQAVARLPQGALVLPGFDFDLPPDIWASLDDPLLSEDHPQYRYIKLLRALDMAPQAVRLWDGPAAPDPARNRLISLALRPAPVTDRWLAEGPGLGDLVTATAGLTLIEAPNPQAEALSIALILRQAALDGQRAALITPDRALGRMVSAALDRWHLRPDDSAGRPLIQSAPGRFLRHLAEAAAAPLRAEALIALLKHPLTCSGPGRGAHLLMTRALELWVRRQGLPFPDRTDLVRWAGADVARADWVAGLVAVFDRVPGPHPLPQRVAALRSLAETLSGPDGTLWDAEAGAAARAAMDQLAEQSDPADRLDGTDFCALLDTVLASGSVRDSVQTHPDVMIWGTLEARVQGADLVVLAGLNDGTWPAAPAPDPWFNRRMRLEAGLLLPERQIGLSAHDFQLAAGAARVVLTRASRDAEAETIPSRWLNRLLNLIAGLPAQNGPAALAAMRARGAGWLDDAARLTTDLGDIPDHIAQRNPRPAPAPPRAARPRRLSVTEIQRLVRDPYQIHARHVLRLRPLDPLTPSADPRLRGTTLHRILDAYTRAIPPGAPADPARLLSLADDILASDVPWAAARIFWRARLAGVAQDFADWHAARPGTLAVQEHLAEWTVTPPGVTLTGKPDRIDLLPDARAAVFDYKTGTPPTPRQQAHFDKQVILLALMAENGAFGTIGPAEVAEGAFIGLGSEFKVQPADITPGALERHRVELERLFTVYLDPAQGFTARRAMKKDSEASDFDQLSRLGEWQVTDTAVTLPLGDHDA